MMAARGSRPVVRPPVDRPACVRAASFGLSILLVGGVASGLVVRALPAVADGWLPLVSAVAYTVAGWRIGEADRPWLQGLLAATLAWGLALPIRLFASTIPTALVFADLVVAAAFGAAAGYLAGRRRGPVVEVTEPVRRRKRRASG
jgi:hypothetical protein